MDTHQRINFWENPQGNVALGFDEGPDFDCPIIDPNDPTWCDANSEGQYYPVKCKSFVHSFTFYEFQAAILMQTSHLML